MRNLIAFLALFYSFAGFSQTDYRLVNKLDCDLVFNVRVVESSNCSNIVSTTSVTVPAHTYPIFTVPAGAEIMHVAVGFAVNNCAGMHLSSPANTACPNCPNWFLSQSSWVSTCNNNCQGMTINSKWFQSCTGVDQIVFYH